MRRSWYWSSFCFVLGMTRIVSADNRRTKRPCVVRIRLRASSNEASFTKIVMGSSFMSFSNRTLIPPARARTSKTSLVRAFWNLSVMGCLEPVSGDETLFCFSASWTRPSCAAFRSGSSSSARSKASAASSSRPPFSRSEEHTSELQSLAYLVCRLLLEKKKHIEPMYYPYEQHDDQLPCAP